MKKGISLIVLVITIIVMIILASSVVISLSNTGIISKADQSIDMVNDKQVQDLASLIWADAYMEGLRDEYLANEVISKLNEQGINDTNWDIIVSNKGVSATNVKKRTSLGSLITPANYGDTVNYTVTVNGITYDEWQIYYHNSDYIYIISRNSIGNVPLNKGTTVASLTSDELALYEKFRVGTADKYTLVDTKNGNPSYNSQAVAQLIKDYSNFANTATYGSDVVGAIGGPTMELLVAGWNAKGYAPSLECSIDNNGYKINNAYNLNLTSDGFYIPTNYWYWLAAPSDFIVDGVMGAGNGKVSNRTYDNSYSVRPVVCLKANIKAIVGDENSKFCLIKQ